MPKSIYLNGIYTKQQMAEILQANLDDTNHTAQNRRKLKRWGYEYTKTEDGQFQIAPIALNNTTGRLNYLLEYYLGLAPQTNLYGFACFLYEMNNDGDFSSMPWKQRAIVLNDKFGVAISDRTLYNWMTKLMKAGLVKQQKGLTTNWRTTRQVVSDDLDLAEEDGNWIFIPDSEQKDRVQILNAETGEMVEGYREVKRQRVDMNNPQLMKEFMIYQKERQRLREANLSEPEIAQIMWNKFNCRYFKCETFELNINDETINLVVAEVCEIIQNQIDEVEEEYLLF